MKKALLGVFCWNTKHPIRMATHFPVLISRSFKEKTANFPEYLRNNLVVMKRKVGKTGTVFSSKYMWNCGERRDAHWLVTARILSSSRASLRLSWAFSGSFFASLGSTRPETVWFARCWEPQRRTAMILIKRLSPPLPSGTLENMNCTNFAGKIFPGQNSTSWTEKRWKFDSINWLLKNLTDRNSYITSRPANLGSTNISPFCSHWVPSLAKSSLSYSLSMNLLVGEMTARPEPEGQAVTLLHELEKKLKTLAAMSS